MSVFDKFTKLELESKEYGFYWPDIKSTIRQVLSELQEVEEVIEKNEGDARLYEEIGDLMHAVCSLCLFCDFDPETALRLSTEKYEKRFNLMKKIAQDSGIENFKAETMDVMMNFWNKAKLMQVK